MFELDESTIAVSVAILVVVIFVVIFVLGLLCGLLGLLSNTPENVGFIGNAAMMGIL